MFGSRHNLLGYFDNRERRSLLRSHEIIFRVKSPHFNIRAGNQAADGDLRFLRCECRKPGGVFLAHEADPPLRERFATLADLLRQPLACGAQ